VYHPDHLGSSNLVSDYEGKVFEHVEYMPYGETWIDEAYNTEITGFKFTSKELDPETRMYYYGARHMDPMFSRWMSVDPGEDGLNWYGYCNGNPVNYVDPTGCWVETAWDVVSLGTGIVSFANSVKNGDVLGASVDAVGIALPLIPGGVGAAVKTARIAKAARKVEQVGQKVVAARDIKEGIESGDKRQVALGASSLVTGGINKNQLVKKSRITNGKYSHLKDSHQLRKERYLKKI